MSKRAYGQFCGLARALDIVGERWTLLIIRDLLVRPRRFTDLHRGLPRIPTNILTARLRELERAGVVRRQILPRPAGSVVYELTEYGRDLEDVVLSLGRWGARVLGDQAPEEITTVDSLTMAMRSTFLPENARGRDVRYEVRFGRTVLHLHVSDGTLRAAPGPSPDPDLIIHAGIALRSVMTGEIDVAEAIADGHLRVTGDPELFEQFVEMFHIPSAPAGVAA